MSDKPSAAWYLAPIFMGIVGSAIMWYVLKDEDHPDSPKMVRKGWVIGIILTVISVGWIPFMLIPMAFIDDGESHLIHDPDVEQRMILPTSHKFTTEAVIGIAQQFIKSSPTFAFDGMEETLSLELVAVRESFPEQFVIEADFDSLHGGYGDRTDLMVIQVITPHAMNLVVINGEVTSAILDGKWDELNQLQLPWTPTKGPDETVSQENVPRFSLEYTKEGGIAGIRKVINIDSDENIITIEKMNEKVQSTIFEPEIAELFKLIEDSEFFTIEQRDYPPQVGWADFFIYYLKITTESGEYQMNWTDASEITPESAQSIATQIESMANQTQCEDIDGLWGIWSNRSPATESCNLSTSDGGMECSDSSQCQSFCQAKEGAQIGTEDTGMCYGYELAICMKEVRDGVVDPEWCQ